MSKRHHILFARTDVASHPVLATDSNAASGAMIETPDLQEWLADDWRDQLDDLEPGFYVWEGYFLLEEYGHHVDTQAVRPARAEDFFMLGYPLPRGDAK